MGLHRRLAQYTRLMLAELVKQECLKQLLRYMVVHPAAMDTIEGIREWWLRDISQTVSEDTLAMAIEELELIGWLIRRDTAASKVLYHINPNTLEEIRESLQE
jgi:hypothetical protein